jgi:hypothetical protein
LCSARRVENAWTMPGIADSAGSVRTVICEMRFACNIRGS